MRHRVFQRILQAGTVHRTFALTLALLAVTFAALAVAALLVGSAPLDVIRSLLEGALQGRFRMISTLIQTSAVVMTGLAVLLPYQVGFFNVGGQGQLEVGALAGVAITLGASGPALLVIPLSFTLAALAGVVAVAVPLLLRIKRSSSEVTTTIMMNAACIYLVLGIITGPLKDPAAFYGTTHPVPNAYQLPVVPGAVGLHIGVWLVLAITIGLHLVMTRTVFGVKLRAVGGNRPAAIAAGIPADRILAIAVITGGALAGLAGGMQALGVVHRVAEGWAKPWGFAGISAALLGGSPLGVVPVAFVFAILETGARHMQAMTGVPVAVVYLLQGLPVLTFLGLRATRYFAR